jgi:uncharacterized protein YbjT (DUF2867 family)
MLLQQAHLLLILLPLAAFKHECSALLPVVATFLNRQRPSSAYYYSSSYLFSLPAASSEEEQLAHRDGSSSGSSRRDLLSFAVSTVSALTLTCGIVNNPVFAQDIGSNSDSPIVVLGAGGKVGKLCTQILASKKLHVRAVTRDGRSVLAEQTPFVSYVAADVTKFNDALLSSMKGGSGAIFAASASKNGGDAAHVDYLGVYNAAKAAIATKVPKLVVISSGAVTRPTSIGFKITNVFGRIMDYKIAGEVALREAYAQPDASGLSYTIIRPGGLSNEPSKGASGVEVSQGDILSSEIGREDVAFVTVAAILKGAATDNATLEVYGSGGETMFGMKTGPAKLAGELPDNAKFLHRSNTYEGLLDGLLNDAEMKKTGIVGDYKGKGVEPLESLV